jgi:Undecaprenyl-phosphate galactose phosphotransferase WbaP
MKPVITHQDQDFFSGKPDSPLWRYRRWIMIAFMLVSDFACLLLSIWSALLIWQRVRADLFPDLYQSLILPISGLFVAIYFMMGLYPGIGVGPVEELRRLSIGSSLGMLAVMGLTFYLRNITMWSRAVLGLTWIFLLITAPLARKIFRRLAVRLGLWGMPVAIFGETDGAATIYSNLRKNPLTGLKPVLCVKADSIQRIFPSPSRQKDDPWDGNALFRNINIAIIVPQKAPLGAVKNVLLDKSHRFKRIIVMFDDARMGSVWFTPLHLVEHLGLEVTHQLINPTQQVIKRLLDLALILVSLPVLIPVFALISLAIKLDSSGPVFYTQKRVGHGGKDIRIWKFRSMVSNAEGVLKKYLDANPSMRAEWEESFKLKRDPRITRMGNFLRRTSLDELPQLWNVLHREMSLIGPRPIVTEEIALYGEDFEIFKQVLPGMTGMWQISGRNDLTYRERVNLDVYYVQNWSIWLDIHILIHTLLAAFQGRGAY